MSCSSFRQKSKARNGKVSALGVCGFIEGVLQVIPVAGNFTADIVIETIEQQLLPLLPRNVFLVADNASVHDEPRLCAILRKKNITVITLPAFAYDLNPIEMVFAQAKAIAHHTPGFVENLYAVAYKSKNRLLQIWSKLLVTKTASGYCHLFEYIIYCKHTSRICSVSYNCVDKYIRFFQQKATLTPAISDNASPKKMEWWKEAYLEALVRIYPTIYLHEVPSLLAGDFNLAPRDVPSISTIARLLTALRITREVCACHDRKIFAL